LGAALAVPARCAHASVRKAAVAAGRNLSDSRVVQWGKQMWRGGVIIGLIVLVAALVRLAGIDFGLPALLDPDELVFELASYRQIEGGTLNPGWFGHPATTTIYALTLVNALVFAWGWLSGAFGSVGEFAQAIVVNPGLLILPGRVMIVAFSLWCVVLVHKLARKLFDPPTALAAAAMVAISPVMVTWSQVIRSDVMATAFMLCTMLHALDYLRRPALRSVVIAAALAGAATATKWPFALTLVSLLAAIVAAHARRRAEWPLAARRMALAGLATLVSLLVISPFLVLDFQTLAENLQGEAQKDHLGSNGFGFVGNAWFYLSGPLLAALGPVGLTASLVGAAMGHRAREWRVVVGVPLACFLVLISAQNLIWERWVVPLIPMLAISAAGALVWAVGRVGEFTNSRALRALLTSILAVAIVVPPASDMIERYRQRTGDPRATAANWARDNLPPGSSLLIEHFAFDMVQSTNFKIMFPIGTAGCLDVRELLAGQVDYRFVDSLRGGNSNLDYAAVPPDMLHSCQTDYAIVSEYSRYVAEADRYPEKLAAYRRLFGAAQVVRRFDAASPLDQRAHVYLLRTDPAQVAR
jgi:hypothetical protein